MILVLILAAALLALTSCDRLLAFGSREVSRDGGRELGGGPADHRVDGERFRERGADHRASDRRVERGPAASCTGLPPGTECFFPAGQGECDGAGKCLECLPEGNQCGPGDPASCCGGLNCMGSKRSPGFDTCGGI